MTPTVLIVEDEGDAAELLKDLLELSGYRVLLAHDGVEGLARATAERPDVIVSDVMMPRMDGLEMIARLSRNPDTRTIPVVVVSAMDDVDHQPALVKPVALQDLIEEIERQLGRG